MADSEWVAAYQRGDTYAQIAQRAGVDPTTVCAHVREFMPSRRTGPPRRRDITVEDVVTYRQAGWTYPAIAAALGCSQTLVQSRLAEAGMAPHPDRRPRTGRRKTG